MLAIDAQRAHRNSTTQIFFVVLQKAAKKQRKFASYGDRMLRHGGAFFESRLYDPFYVRCIR